MKVSRREFIAGAAARAAAVSSPSLRAMMRAQHRARVSLELDGPVGSDRALLSLGLSVERVLGRIATPKIG